MNSYFASAEQQANPFLRGRAVGVTGRRPERSVVAAASREAKRLGIRTAMGAWEARRTLPSLLLVAADAEKYEDLTRRLNAVFHEFTDLVEPTSVDESFLDVTDAAGDFLGAVVVAQAIKERLSQECGEWMTASIGVATSKEMAKLASDRQKPDGLVVVPPGRETELLDASKLTDLCGIGPRVEARLFGMGIRSFRELRERPVLDLTAEFHSYGEWLHRAARGEGDDAVVPGDGNQKTYGHSYTLPRDADDAEDIERFLLLQCDKVARRLRRDGLAARGVAAYVRFGDFSEAGRQRQSQEPVNDGLKIFKLARELIRPFLNSGKSVRLVGVSASNLARGTQQASLFEKERRMRSALAALDAIQSRYGDDAWTRASVIAQRHRRHHRGPPRVKKF
jgi:DNA polymerase-4